MKAFFRSIYIANRLYYVMAAEVVFYVFSFFFPGLYDSANYALVLILSLIAADTLILFMNRKGFFARRDTYDKLSNGDRNPVSIYLENNYVFKAYITVIDELPFQFQSRNNFFRLSVDAGGSKTLEYVLTPQKRGEYRFGAINVFVKSPIGFIEKRYRFSQDMMVPVYPSFIQMRKYELYAISNRLVDTGLKKIRRIGTIER